MEIYVRVLVRSNIAWRQERNINYASKRELNFMKALWRQKNAGIFIFYVSYVMIVNNNKTKVVHFVYTPDIMSRASLHIRYRKILISCGQ